MPAGENSAAPPRQPSSLRQSAATVASDASIAPPSSGLNRKEDAAPVPLMNTRGTTISEST